MAEVAKLPSSQKPDSFCLNQIIQLKKYTGKISLVIPDFLVWLDSQDSQVEDFSLWSEPLDILASGKEVLQFTLKISFNKTTDDEIGVYLHSSNSRNLRMEYSFTVSKNQQFRVTKGLSEFSKEKGWGFKSFLTKTNLKGETTQYLPGGVLTVACQFTFSVSESEISTSHNRASATAIQSTCLANNLKTMWKKEELTDFKLICEDKVFPCHKFVLASRSDVFEAMFRHEDISETLTGKAIIKDCTPQVLSDFLEFLYTDQLENKDNFDSCELMLLADKYNIPSLKKVCEKNLGLNLNCSNAIKKLNLAAMVTAPELLEIAAKFVTNHFHKLYGSEDWKVMIEHNTEALHAIGNSARPQEQASQPTVSNHINTILELLKQFKM